MTSEGLKKVIANVLEIDPQLLSSTQRLCDLETYDSVKILSLMVALHDEVGVSIDHKDVDSFITYSDIEKTVRAKGVALTE